MLLVSYFYGSSFANKMKRNIETDLSSQQKFNKIRVGGSKVLALAFFGVFPYGILIIAVSVFYQIPAFLLFESIFIYSAFIFSIGYLVHNRPYNIIRSYLKANGIKFSLLSLEYSPTGRLKNWAKATRKLNEKKKWLEKIYPYIEEKLAPIESDPLTIISPAANNANYEKRIAIKLAKQLNKPIRFIACDQLEDIEEDRSINIDHKLLEFHFWKNTPYSDLPKKLETLNISQVDCILDFKGVIWHHWSEEKEANTIFKYFDQLLKPGGIYILDATDSNHFSRFWNVMALRLFGRIRNYAEESTYLMIKKFLGDPKFLEHHSYKVVENKKSRMLFITKDGGRDKLSSGFKHDSASRQLRKVYGANGWIGGFGAISLNTATEVQDKLVKECTIEQIGQLKTGLGAQVEFMKQLNLILSITIFVLTLIITPVNFYIQQSMKTIDWKHEIRSLVVREELNLAKDGGERAKILLDYANQIKIDEKDYNQSLSNLQDQFYSMLRIIAITFLVPFIFLFFRYRWLLSAHAYLEDALKLKESKQKKKQESLRQIRMR